VTTSNGRGEWMKIYTKGGDGGETSLYDNTRVPKDHIRVESYGTIDELNSALGLSRGFIDNDSINNLILGVQRELFNVAGELATADYSKFPQKITEEKIKILENEIDSMLGKINIEQQNKFIIPGSCHRSASLHLARTICRRAERRIVTLSREADIRPEVIKYINRLSDWIYALARTLECSVDYVDFKK
jgi:cob(I)alamin adenosyltransferase